MFTDFKPLSNTEVALAVEQVTSPIEGTGTVTLFFGEKLHQQVTLEKVMYAPKLRRNLISGSTLDSLGMKFTGQNGKIKVYGNDGSQLFYAVKYNGLYVCKPKYKKSIVANTVSVNDIHDWHSKFCHINPQYIVNTSKKNSVFGLPELKLPQNFDCEPCKLAKTKRKSFKPLPEIRSKKPLQLLHMDVCGKLPCASLGGSKYFLSIIDDFSRKVTVYPLKSKSEVFSYFKKYQARAERFLGSKIMSIRSDNGKVFDNEDFVKYLNSQGINVERTSTYTPQQNGVAERYNYTAVDGIKSMLNSSGLSDKFWAEALLCFTYKWNRICHQNKSKTPFELYSGRKPSVKHLQIFGCKVYIGIPKNLRSKFDMRAKIGTFVGYALRTKGYRVWMPESKKVIETIHVTFPKNENPAVKTPNVVNYSLQKDQSDDSSDEETPKTSLNKLPWIRKAVKRKDGSRIDIYYTIQGTNLRLRSYNDVKKYCEKKNIEYNPNFFNFSGANSYSGKVSDYVESEDIEINVFHTNIIIPNTFKQACNSPQKENWHSAMKEEINTMKDRKVWELVPKPKNVKVLGNRWVFTAKHNENNEVVRYKGRLVAQGHLQTKGETYDEVFSPVINFCVLRLFFTIFVSFLHWTHCQIDIKNAYLYAPLNSRPHIYMKQPIGFVDKKHPDYVCLLKKAVYGLHQSGREWFFKLHEDLAFLQFKKFKWTNCVYVLENRVILLVYVDDIVIFGKTQDDVNLAIKKLKEKFDIKILGKTKKLLGIQFEEKNGKLAIHQEEYINKILSVYSKYNIPIISLPIAKGFTLSKSSSPKTASETNEMQNIPYRNLIGCLTYLATHTRPDISYAINIFSQFQSNPGKLHWEGLLKLLGYVGATKNYRLDLSRIDNIDLTCFTDADFAANRDDRVSLGGFILFIGSVPISWRTLKQKCVALSTMESEFIALTEAAKELLWLSRIVEEIRLYNLLNLNFSSTIMCDNLSTISFANSPIENQRTKHVHIKYFFVRDLLYRNVFDLKFVNSKDNLADPLTKPQSKISLLKFVNSTFMFE